MEHGDGREPDAKRAAGGGGGGEDFISALPDDLLIQILVRLRSAASAAKTSALSRRWRPLWAQMPDLVFSAARDTPDRIRAAIDDHRAPALLKLHVVSTDATADSVAAWIPIAARRVSGIFCFVNKSGDGGQDRGAFELPCFEHAGWLVLDLGSLGLSMPTSGVSARLTNLYLCNFKVQGPCVLGDALSTPRCPCLQKLTVSNARGIGKFSIHSESLLRLKLSMLYGLQQLTVVAPALKDFCLNGCLRRGQPIVNISAPQLESLEWMDLYDPCSVQFGEMPHLQQLHPYWFIVHGIGQDDFRANRSCLRLMQQFKAVHSLKHTLLYHSVIGNHPYMMADIARLPDLTSLSLAVLANGHSFGASSFHILRMYTGIRKLTLNYLKESEVSVETSCSSGCICDQLENWKTEELVLNQLQEAQIIYLLGTEHEIAFLRRFFSWAAVLKTVTISFDKSVAESKAQQLCQTFRSFPRPETHMKFYRYQGLVKKVLYVPEEGGLP